MIEYSDYLCPYCARHFSLTVPALIEQDVATGQVKYVYRDMPLVGLHPTAPVGHEAALCVAEQGAALPRAASHSFFFSAVVAFCGQLREKCPVLLQM